MALHATAALLIAQVGAGIPHCREACSPLTPPPERHRSDPIHPPGANFAHRGKTDNAWLTYGSGIGLRGAAGTNIDE